MPSFVFSFLYCSSLYLSPFVSMAMFFHNTCSSKAASVSSCILWRKCYNFWCEKMTGIRAIVTVGGCRAPVSARDKHWRRYASEIPGSPWWPLGRRFDAIATGASEKGTWVRLFHPPVEGKLMRGFEGLDVGDRVRVQLIGTDVERGFIDFARSGWRRGNWDSLLWKGPTDVRLF